MEQSDNNEFFEKDVKMEEWDLDGWSSETPEQAAHRSARVAELRAELPWLNAGLEKREQQENL